MSDILEAFEEYLSVTRALDPLTVEAYLRDLSQLETFAPEPLPQRNTQDILAFLAQFDNKRTLNRKLSAINVFLTFVTVMILPLLRLRSRWHGHRKHSRNMWVMRKSWHGYRRSTGARSSGCGTTH